LTPSPRLPAEIQTYCPLDSPARQLLDTAFEAHSPLTPLTPASAVSDGTQDLPPSIERSAPPILLSRAATIVGSVPSARISTSLTERPSGDSKTRSQSPPPSSERAESVAAFAGMGIQLRKIATGVRSLRVRQLKPAFSNRCEH
jgi:hypothetical protein